MGILAPALRVLGRCRTGVPSALSARGPPGSGNHSCDCPGGNEDPTGFQFSSLEWKLPWLEVADIRGSEGCPRGRGLVSRRAAEEEKVKQ